MSAITPPARSVTGGLPHQPTHQRQPPLQRAPTPPQPPQGPLVPNVMIPGVTHAGAAMLTADLGRHPQVCLPSGKRIDHFTPIKFGREVHGDLADYDLHFAAWSGERYRIETCPVYLDGGRRMVQTINTALPGLRVIIVLRDPADRLWTSYTDKLARGRLPRAIGYETYVDRCLALRANGADRFEGNRHFRSLSGGFYVEHLPFWLDTFGRRARVVFTEHLQDEPVPHVGAVFDWLGLNPSAALPPDDDELSDEQGPGPGVFAQAFDRRLWPMLVRTPGPWRQTDLYRANVARRVPRQSDRLRNRVRSLYAGANRELAALLLDRGYRDLPTWLAID